MALHNLKITVVDGGGAGRSNQIFKDSESGTPASNKLNNINSKVENTVSDKVIGITHFATHAVMSIAKGTAKQGIKYFTSDIGRRNGDSNYQATVERQIEVFSDVGSVVGSAWASAKVGGAILPGVGHVLGFLIGATASSINLGFKYAERERAYQHEMFQESTSQAHNLARANFQQVTGRMR